MTKNNNRTMNAIAKRVAVGSLSVFIISSGSVPAYAIETTYDQMHSRVVVCGTSIEDIDASGSGWSYDSTTNTLTLEDLEYSGPGTFYIDMDPVDEDEDELDAADDEDWDDEDEEDDDEDWDDDEDDEDDDEDWDDDDDEDEEADDDEDDEDDYEEVDDDEVDVIEEIHGVIYADGDLNIELKGDSQINITEANEDSKHGINVQGNCNINGDGKLTVTGIGWSVDYGKVDNSRLVDIDGDRTDNADEDVWVDVPDDEIDWDDVPVDEDTTPAETPAVTEDDSPVDNTEDTPAAPEDNTMNESPVDNIEDTPTAPEDNTDDESPVDNTEDTDPVDEDTTPVETPAITETTDEKTPAVTEDDSPVDNTEDTPAAPEDNTVNESPVDNTEDTPTAPTDNSEDTDPVDEDTTPVETPAITETIDEETPVVTQPTDEETPVVTLPTDNETPAAPSINIANPITFNPIINIAHPADAIEKPVIIGFDNAPLINNTPKATSTGRKKKASAGKSKGDTYTSDVPVVNTRDTASDESATSAPKTADPHTAGMITALAATVIGGLAALVALLKRRMQNRA